MKTRVFYLFILMTLIDSVVYGGMFKMEKQAYFVQYLHVGGKKLEEVNLNGVKVGVGYIRRVQNTEKPARIEPFKGIIELTRLSESTKVIVVEVAFIEGNNSVRGRIFHPIEVRDYEMITRRKPKINFLGEYRKLPILWDDQSGRSIYMDFPPIPEEIKEGQLLVKLKIVTPAGEENFEKRFPLFQKTFVGTKKILD